MSACPACELAATNPWTGVFQAGCRQCTIRHVAILPPRDRNAAYAAVVQSARREFAEAVNAEQARMRSLAYARAGAAP